MKMKTTIGGISAELVINQDWGTSCDLTKGTKYGSLNVALTLGVWGGDDTKISDRDMEAIKRIEDWALKNGY